MVVWDAATGRQLAAVEAPTLYTWDGVQRNRSIGGVRALAFSPDGAHLAVGGVGQINNVDSIAGPSRVEVFDWQQRQRVLEFTGTSRAVADTSLCSTEIPPYLAISNKWDGWSWS